MLDLRIPTGYFFSILGMVLIALGIFEPNLRAPLTPANVNLYVGFVLALFGGSMLWLAYRRT
ncbi:MAG TPA: hypothetical protein VE621_02070 [Bryobacteraceae bacterium]|jgi:hypothetical protein|nr:hypothetical protein [Bryobacteraceae bacterium]